MLNFGELAIALRWLKFNPTGTEMKAYEDQYDLTKTGMVGIKVLYEIANKKIMEPDTFEELVDAMKLLDMHNDGTIPVPELRWAMSTLADPLEGSQVDEMIKELDSENKGFVVILDFAKMAFNIKEKKEK